MYWQHYGKGTGMSTSFKGPLSWGYFIIL